MNGSNPASPALPPCPFAVVAPTPFYSPGGCSARILGEIGGMPATQRTPTVFTYGTGADVPGLRTVRVGPKIAGFTGGFHWSRPIFDALLSKAILSSRERPRSLHVHLHEGGLIGRIARTLRNVPYVVDLQGSLVEEVLRRSKQGETGIAGTTLSGVEHLAENGASYVVVSSPSMYDRLQTRLPNLRERVFLIDDGIPDASILNAEDRARYRREVRSTLGDAEGSVVIAYVGSLSASQGIDRLIAAAPGILRSVPTATFRIYGTPNPGFSISRYTEAARRLGVESRIRFMGAVPYEQATRALAAADIAVSWKANPFEANGKIAVYLGAGVPTVAIRSPIVERYLGKGGERGGVIAADADEAAQCVVRLARDPELRERLGNAALSTARDRLGWSVRSGQILDLHRRLYAS
ncbi:MAG: glycosyltransferase family 4 protein [Thermoplasmata archaeon]